MSVVSCRGNPFLSVGRTTLEILCITWQRGEIWCLYEVGSTFVECQGGGWAFDTSNRDVSWAFPVVGVFQLKSQDIEMCAKSVGGAEDELI